MKNFADIKDFIVLRLDALVSKKLKFKTLPLKKIRIGTSYGGWAIPGDFINSSSVCYSAGAGDDISFDIGLAGKFGCKIIIFDPTPKALAHFNSIKKEVAEGKNSFGIYTSLDSQTLNKIEFVPEGLFNDDTDIKLFFPANEHNVSLSLWAEARTEEFIVARVRSLDSLMKERGHNHIDLLKIDIEGAEFPVLQDIIDKDLDIRIICIELHKKKIGDVKQIRDTINRLAGAGYGVIDNNNLDFTFIKASAFGLNA